MIIPADTIRYPEERRLATVLFADVQGFTALAEQLDFETVSDLLKGIWERLDKAIERNNGFIDKHLGDGVMGIWGAPFASENDAEQAINAGLDLIKALQGYCETCSIPGARSLKLRVGINTGLVFAGYVGTRNEYTVLGDTVNLANRLEQIAEAGTVVIGENTQRMVRGSFKINPLPPTVTKGKTELVQPYVVEAHRSSRRMRSENIDSLTPIMVGRNEELEKLKSIYAQAFNAEKPLLTLINADVGLGKTRLLLEFSNLLKTNEQPITIFSTIGLVQPARKPFALWKRLFQVHFGLQHKDPAPLLLQKLEQGLDNIWENNQQNIKHAVLLVLLQMVGDKEPTDPIDSANIAHICAMSCQLLQRLSLGKPLVIFLDDLQQADRESLQMLASLFSTESAPFKALIVAAARPEFLKNQSHWHNLARVINLDPLELTASMISQAYPHLGVLPEAILDEVGLYAEGNPYFMQEIIKSLLKSNLLDANVDLQEVRNHLLSHIPEPLRATMQARIDNLSREVRTVALLASVVGRVFWVGAVLAEARSNPLPDSASSMNAPDAVLDRFVQGSLRQLVRAELIIPRNSSKFSEEQEYYFKNSYLREVAYSLIPNRNLAQYHNAIAEWMRQMDDAQFIPLATDHEQKAISSAKISTGGLSIRDIEK